ncbi:MULTISPECIES: DNA mismatch repair protein MutS [Staphylococcus]|jgi:DNA mismatch repair protein MutS|uniref:DNA mismatch repair protein MutS n=1 Tax=Staphylococcus TaxID=1279 RepID=UPI0002EC1290|nr:MULTISPECIES: DNA mismatch repair protein MutS [Staphylococcus]EUZ70252.1 DNA mismatch repair protein mutS [Staphylococcus sp. M0480]OFK82655.1 DNA mismatch repair protein MutS [Staphylococcus sp. HMSC057A02]OFM60009.1 DNA mismatch repair protein MutS [Staphylococcus sp. HMSC059G05]OFM63771.1 DNA mismatch repair protein MutS [Staphylococcus sp. HMSC062C01]OFM79714.1 DNA mismatch repair protein MutS [Staphylococcus sp. HMSC074B09]OFM95773.1 DNA mismatch repair protein MutS [Staphylococcus s
MANVTPMMQQYLKIKSQYQDCLLFFRLGDFYEMFFEDAKEASRVLEITLTKRDAKKENPIPMCGVPYHSANSYIETLINNGYKVAICEQMEDPKQTKGMVKREVVKVVTPGTMMEQGGMDENQNNYILSFIQNENGYALSYCDVSTGELKATNFEDESTLINEIITINPNEIVVREDINEDLKKQISLTTETITVREEISDMEYSVNTLENNLMFLTTQLLLDYIHHTQKRDLSHIEDVITYAAIDFMKMDYYAKRNLELTESIRLKSKKGTLLWLMDETKTPMGARRLKQWIDRPLIHKDNIEQRLDIVESFIDHFIERDTLRGYLNQVYDIERLVGRVSYGNVNARDLIQLKHSISEIPNIKSLLEQMNSVTTTQFSTLEPLEDLLTVLEDSLVEEPPISVKDGGLFKQGFSKQLDEYLEASKNGKDWLAQLQAKERERTGIKSLKISYNKVFGYFIEITRANLQGFEPSEHGYHRKQTLSNAERFITDELKEKEDIILGAEDKAIELEYQLFIRLREHVKSYTERLQRQAKVISELDCLQSFAEIAQKYNYVRPKFSDDKTLNLENSRHPVVERVMDYNDYVPNDCYLDQNNFIYLITGPNMSGKSTYMRQVAIISIMAQMGAYVPCDNAILPIFDQIFTRIGAADDLVSGKSTFMVEMLEAQKALTYATADSLIIFDEIGRGTSTYDGLSLAQAMIEYVSETSHAKTLFSTHYHELTTLDQQLSSLKNVHVAADEYQGELIFLHKVKEGAVDDSYGIQVAKLANLPEKVIERAQVILNAFEQNGVLDENVHRQHYNDNSKDIENKNHLNNKEEHSTIKQTDVFEQTSFDLFNSNETQSEIEAQIKNLNISNMTPIEALLKLSELQNQLR